MSLGAVALTLAAPALAEPRAHGLVVGVSDYAAFGAYEEGQSGQPVYDLLGAANDARLVAQSMRDAGIDLPDARLLLDEHATKAAFLAAWRQMLDTAAPGDRLIVTFAGHGAQETERSEPYDEADQRDEILMFHDFDPDQPGVGRLTDDALQVLFAEAAEYQVIWVADSCHSGGLTRNASRTLSRFAGLFEGLEDPSLADVPLATGDDAAPEHEALAHVTQILATASEDRIVKEVEIGGRMHGALSWYFAQSLKGQADADNDGQTTRAELRNYLDTRVYTLMNQTQQPQILPRGDAELMFASVRDPGAPESPVAAGEPARPQVVQSHGGDQDVEMAGQAVLPVTILGARPPGLDGARIREVALGAALSFEEEASGVWAVFNQTGDRVTRIDATGRLDAAIYALPRDARPILQRTRVLQSLKGLVAAGADAPQIRLKSGDGTMYLGEEAAFVYTGPAAALPYLTLFNVASNGKLQLVYPVGGDGAQTRDQFQIAFEVTKPTGVDQLFALACPTPPREMRAYLRDHDQKTVPVGIIDRVAHSGCRIAVAGLYTEDRP